MAALRWREGDGTAEDDAAEHAAAAAAEQAAEVERSVHAGAATRAEYDDGVLRCARNCLNRPHGVDHRRMMRLPDARLVGGTLVERVRRTEDERHVVFHSMLQEKYESIQDAKSRYASSLKCRRCNGSDVSWEQKQTRSADEAATVFCVCATCHNRWTIR